MKQLLISVFLMCTIGTYSQKNEIIHLWPGKVPGETNEKRPPEKEASKNDNILRFSKVTDPALEVFLPDKTAGNNSAVIVCPGGGYQILAYDLEGTEIAKWLNKLGYTAFVLQYRVPEKREGALQDIQRAIRLVRKNAGKFNIKPEKTGIIGFSAGGSLCARASSMSGKKTYDAVDVSDSLSCKPSFTMLIYPAYLDEGPDKTLTPELKLSKNVPPVFIFQTADDPYGNSSLVMAQSLRNTGLPVELHFLAKGGHGYGLRPGNYAAETWPLLAEKWMHSLKK